MEIVNSQQKTFLVSVCLLTYNHKDFIEKAIQSILHQKTNFEFNIVIADDCSTDGTIDIIKKYVKSYPEKITLLLQNNNIGVNLNFMQLLLFPRGKYIAYLEGDDYWIAENKLQMQFDFLENNKEIILSTHNTNILLSSGQSYFFNRKKKYLEGKSEDVYSIFDFIEYPFFHASSIFFRNSTLREFPEWFPNVFGADLFFVLMISMQGDIHFINESLSVYRRNNSSISNYFSNHEISNNTYKYLGVFDKYSELKYHFQIEKRRFSIKYDYYYYYPNYLKKLWFATINFKKILRMNPDIVSKSSRFRIFIPTFFLRSKVNLFEKK